MDRMLIMHGAYIPAELLLDLGWLRYSDYEAWRYGRRRHLDDAIAGDIRDAVRLLRDAADWAGRLGLEAEPQVYFGWGDCAGRELSFGDGGCPGADALLATHYVPAAHTDGVSQLDIFTHSGTTAALAALHAALRARDRAAAGRAFEQLRSQAPRHRLIPAAERVTGALATLSEPLSPDATESELGFLAQVLEPAARDVLGADARGLMGPFWRRLATALAGLPFDPQRPSLHASYAYLRCHDWRRAARAVLDTPGYAEEPALLARLADARRRDGDRKGAVADWFRLCWRFPAEAAARLDDPGFPDRKVREAWIDFRDLDVEPVPPTGFFPAHMLLTAPGLARALAPDLAVGDGHGEQAFRAVRCLLSNDDMAARKAVQTAAPWLLARYLERRG